MIKVFDMFAGYGGAEFALTKAGIEHECVGFSEVDKYAIQCFEQNHKGKCYGDCTKIDPKDLPNFDLLCGGFPCQDVSIAGVRDLSKGRTNLYKEVLRLAEAKKPKYMLLENVKGLLSINKDRNLRDIIINDLRNIGYDVCFKCLNSKDFGIPQNRERVWFVCKLGKWGFNEFAFPIPNITNKKTLKDILEENVESKYYLTEEQITKLKNRFRSYNERMCKEEYSPTLLSRDYKDPKVIQLAILNPYNTKMSTEETGTLGTSCGSVTGVTGQILMDPKKYKGEDTPREYTKNCPTLCARARTDEIPICHNMQSRSIERPSMQKAIKEGKPLPGGYGHLQRSDGLTYTIDTSNNLAIERNCTFRKLTPKECFRLMGFVNDEINLEGISDSQLYKLAGNGWEINIVSLILKEMKL